ncbi:MAG: hypothetical protein J6V36_00045 [Clostridia bacterium]|nr:hypothetical protein [Clostridia bacterium]
MLFYKVKSQEERRSLGGSSFIELQFCKFPLKTKIESLIEKVNFWENDSLYISDYETFYNEYKYIFNCGLYSNLEIGTMDLHGINYYSPSETDRIIDKILKYKPLDYETLIKWLESSKTYNGFYILGF